MKNYFYSIFVFIALFSLSCGLSEEEKAQNQKQLQQEVNAMMETVDKEITTPPARDTIQLNEPTAETDEAMEGNKMNEPAAD